MGRPSRLLFFFYPFFVLLLVTIASAQPLQHICLYEKGNFTINSTYQTNLDRVLTSLSSDTKTTYGFYNSSFGQNPDEVNAISLCRGDKKPDTCLGCIKNSTEALRQSCPNQKEAVIWYDDCMLRYSNRSILGSMEFGPVLYMYNIHNVLDVTKFDETVKSLLQNLTTEAASGDSFRKFATGNTSTTNNLTVYALVQCTPDLSKKQCTDCLTQASTEWLPKCCSGKQGGRVISPSCNFRYEIDSFYDSVAKLPQELSPAPSPEAPLPPTPAATPSSNSPESAPEPETGLPPPPGATPSSKSPESSPAPELTPPSGTIPSCDSSPPPNGNTADITGKKSNYIVRTVILIASVLLLQYI